MNHEFFWGLVSQDPGQGAPGVLGSDLGRISRSRSCLTP